MSTISDVLEMKITLTSNSIFKIGLRPLRAANITAVRPCMVCAFLSMDVVNKNSTQSSCPLATAQCSALPRILEVVLQTLAPYSANTSRTAKRPFCAAKIKGV